MLLELAVVEYIKTFEMVKADHLNYFDIEASGKESSQPSNKPDKNMEIAENECPFCGGLYDNVISHLKSCEFAPDDAEEQLRGARRGN